MSQGARQKPPLDVLQSMINAILIETGKALRPSSKEGGGRTVATVNTRLRTIIPSAVDNFHMALDDLECDIVRAKSVLLRDLDELRAKRIALENPVSILEEVEVAVEEKAVDTNTSNGDSILGDELYTSPQTTIKEERRTKSPEKQTADEPNPSIPEPATEIVTQPPEDVKVPPQAPATPASSDDANLETKPIGLGIKTEGAPAVEEDLQNSAIDSLFDIADDDNGDSALNFDDMDFSLDTTIQNQDTSQTQNNEFDLSNFGDLNPNPNQNQNQTNTNTNTDDQNKLGDDLFAMTQGMGGGDSMDLDLDLSMAGAEDSVFDDMFFGGGDDEGMSGGGEIQHGEFDNHFFGLDE